MKDRNCALPLMTKKCRTSTSCVEVGEGIYRNLWSKRKQSEKYKCPHSSRLYDYSYLSFRLREIVTYHGYTFPKTPQSFQLIDTSSWSTWPCRRNVERRQGYYHRSISYLKNTAFKYRDLHMSIYLYSWSFCGFCRCTEAWVWSWKILF